MKKKPPVEISKMEMEYLATLNERDRRHFIACKASGPNGGSIKAVAKAFHCSPNTVSKAIHEMTHHIAPPDGRQRMPGGGAKRKVDKHPEWVAAFEEIVSSHTAGLPQDESVVWLDINVPQIRREFLKRGHDVSCHVIRGMLASAGLKRRSFLKSLPLREVEDRDAQFVKIGAAKAACVEAGIPVISIDTKKKEMLGNFKREGKAFSNGQPLAYDHDFSTFSDGQIVPHGIYDVTRNVGYMTLGISHDTSKFVCDNIARVWREYLKEQYPTAHTLVILCDGGGSNSSAHRIVKQDLMDLANKLGIRLLVVHYPPYCSKFNPIEHRLFSQVTRSWSGAPLMSLQNAADRAAMTTTKKGLKVLVHINSKTYDIKRPIEESYQKRLARQVVFAPELGKWNYLVKPAN